MNDLAVRTAVRDMLDRSTDLAAARGAAEVGALAGTPLGDRSALPAEAVLVDLASPPRRTRRVLAAAALVAVAAAGALAVTAGSGPDAAPERTGRAQAPASTPRVEEGGTGGTVPVPPADGGGAGEGSAIGDEVFFWRIDGDRLILRHDVPTEPHVRRLVPGIDYDPSFPKDGVLDTFVTVRVWAPGEGPDTGADGWGGAVRTASGEPVALRGGGLDRRVEIDFGDLVVSLGVRPEEVAPADELAALMAGMTIERVH